MVSINVYIGYKEARNEPKRQFQILSVLLPITNRYHVVLRRGKFHGNKGCVGQNISVGRVTWSGFTNVTSIKIKLTIHSQFYYSGLFLKVVVMTLFVHIANK